MKKVILDLDTGIDDGMALAYALGSDEIEIIGVSGTYGNVYTEVGVQNMLNILNMCNANEIPVYAGESHAINKNEFNRLEVSARIHGENGVGQVLMKQSLIKKQSLSAVDFIIESIKKYGKDLTILATGPMSNIAKVIQKEKDIVTKIGKVVIMGGALTIPGNVNPYAEANISQDPEAANLLFESGIDVTMVGLDVTQRSLFTKQHTQAWRDTNTVSGKTYADMVDYYIDQHDEPACYLHDPSAAIAITHPEYFTMLPLFMSVVTKGEAAGRTIGNPNRLHDENPNVKVCIGVNSKALVSHLHETLLNLFKCN